VDRINRDNVENLVPAWSYSLGGEQQPGQASQPLVHDGTLPGAALVTISSTHMGNEADRVHPLPLLEPSVVVVEVTGGVRYAT
jgi:hypothetical protein